MTCFQPRLPLGYRLVFYHSIGSTNEEAARLARAGAPAGTLLWALEQTAGRGRRGRTWVSPPGNLYSSLILRPECPASRACQLGFVAALAIGGAVGAICPGLGASYKWPNDVLINGRKVAGILLESEMILHGKPSFVVVGVGVNLRVAPDDTEFPATSIKDEGGGEVEPGAMLEEFAGHFHKWEICWQIEGFAAVRAAWLAQAAISSGLPIQVRLGTSSLHGRFIDLNEEGALLLDAAGERRQIAAGEVFPVSG
ncbi:MAG: biotin--[acetyl-CoA-carboxylase] ligase [Alphaproteobacteria bacterium]|nr:biotin--[acetyl-CoA-carboxylase] ligase [Alphaproteobacteria bacterium]